jgi:hypothetical protein
VPLRASSNARSRMVGGSSIARHLAKLGPCENPVLKAVPPRDGPYVPKSAVTAATSWHCPDMPRFYIHFEDESGRVPDQAGVDLKDAASARAHAFRVAGDIAAEELRHGRSTVQFRLSVQDESGKHVATVPVNVVIDAVPVVIAND